MSLSKQDELILKHQKIHNDLKNLKSIKNFKKVDIE